MIPEPQRTYVLELMTTLGPAADGFVLAGAQAMKFILPGARSTRDFDFVLDAIRLREGESIARKLRDLGYSPVASARNFQFEKAIPDSREIMRIEFMAPEEHRRENDFRVDVQEGIHGRACVGGSIVIAESDAHLITGSLPSGIPASASLRVIKPHALVMLKCLAMDDRYRNVRGPAQSGHDRDEARIHAADIISIVRVQADLLEFRSDFDRQFGIDPDLGARVRRIVQEYFGSEIAPGLLLYEEFLLANTALGDPDQRRSAASEMHRAQTLMRCLLERSTTFGVLLSAIDDTLDTGQQNPFIIDFLHRLQDHGANLYDFDHAHPLLEPLGAAYRRGHPFETAAAAAFAKLDGFERELIRMRYLKRLEGLEKARPELKANFPSVFRL